MAMIGLSIVLPDEAIAELKAMATRHRRKLREEAAYLLTQELTRWTVPSAGMAPAAVCAALYEWALVAGVASAAGTSTLAVTKSDLLSRLIYGGERGPSRTPCPVHKGKWSGCDFGWPFQEWVDASGKRTPVEIDPRIQAWMDAGCRCAMHKGSHCTTGWNPDEHCCLEPVG